MGTTSINSDVCVWTKTKSALRLSNLLLKQKNKNARATETSEVILRVACCKRVRYPLAKSPVAGEGAIEQGIT